MKIGFAFLCESIEGAASDVTVANAKGVGLWAIKAPISTAVHPSLTFVASIVLPREELTLGQSYLWDVTVLAPDGNSVHSAAGRIELAEPLPQTSLPWVSIPLSYEFIDLPLHGYGEYVVSFGVQGQVAARCPFLFLKE